MRVLLSRRLPEWTRSQTTQSHMYTFPNGHDLEWTQSRKYTISNVHHPECTRSRMGSTPIGPIPNVHHSEWARSRIAQSEWSPSRMEAISNRQNPEWSRSMTNTIPNGNSPEWALPCKYSYFKCCIRMLANEFLPRHC